MILCVGATPTVQRTLRCARVALGEVNRAREVHVTASGKAVNVARVVTLLGGESKLVHCLGGDTGRWVAQMLDRDGVAHDTIWLPDDAPTRTCTTLLGDNAPATELVEEAPPVAPNDVAALEAAVQQHLPSARALCCSGSFPPGVPEDFYARLVTRANEAGVPALIDAQRAPLRAVLAARPFLVKPNREEAAATLGITLSGDAEHDARKAIDALTQAGARWALVSLGATGSLMGDADNHRWRITSPRVEAVNPIGSGDSLAAGLLRALVQGMAVPEAAAWGTACAAANCLTPTSGVVRLADVAALLPSIQLTAL